MDMEVDWYKLARAENASAVLEKRYLKKNQRGEPVEEPMDLFRRVAGNIVEAEEARRLYEKWGRSASRSKLGRKVLPNSPTLMRPLPIRKPWCRYAGQSARRALVSLSR
jgi:ribonucleotide reductase alpha subunit